MGACAGRRGQHFFFFFFFFPGHNSLKAVETIRQEQEQADEPSNNGDSSGSLTEVNESVYQPSPERRSSGVCQDKLSGISQGGVRGWWGGGALQQGHRHIASNRAPGGGALLFSSAKPHLPEVTIKTHLSTAANVFIPQFRWLSLAHLRLRRHH